jgi:iron complex transport system substrate-binding protein
MKNWKHIFILLFFIYACSEKNEQTIPVDNKNIIKYASNLSIFEHSNYTLVQIRNPDTKRIEKQYALTNNSTSVKNLNPKVQIIQTPVKGMICQSSTHIGMLNILDQLNCIRATPNKKYIYNKKVKHKIASGKIKEIDNIENVSPRFLFDLNASIILYSGFGVAFPNEQKLKKLGVICIPNYDWKENTPLGKAEWIKLFGCLTQKLKKANSHFDDCEKLYKIEKRKSTTTKDATIISGSLIGDLWYLPAGESFFAQLFRDAKINYVEKNSKGTGSIARSFEFCFRNYKNTSIWINPGATSKNELYKMNKKYVVFDAFKKNKVFCYSNNASYFWENSACYPHLLLRDINYILNNKDEKLHFYSRLK